MKITPDVISLINEGKSINKIKEITGFAKSTIYHHYKKIKGKKIKEIRFNFKSSNELGEFLGIFSGDGYFYKSKRYHYSIKISIGYYERKYAKYLERRLKGWFSKKPRISYSKYKDKLSCIIIQYDSKLIYNLIKQYLEWERVKTYTIRLKNINFDNKKLNFGFLRGLIDTDGNYYKPKNRISFSTTSKFLALQVYDIIKYNLDITPNIMMTKKINRKPLYTIYLHGEKAYHLIDNIKPQNPNKMR